MELFIMKSNRKGKILGDFNYISIDVPDPAGGIFSSFSLKSDQ